MLSHTAMSYLQSLDCYHATITPTVHLAITLQASCRIHMLCLICSARSEVQLITDDDTVEVTYCTPTRPPTRQRSKQQQSPQLQPRMKTPARMQYPQFLHALLLIAERCHTGFEAVVNKILSSVSSCPTASMADFVIWATPKPGEVQVRRVDITSRHQQHQSNILHSTGVEGILSFLQVAAGSAMLISSLLFAQISIMCVSPTLSCPVLTVTLLVQDIGYLKAPKGLPRMMSVAKARGSASSKWQHAVTSSLPTQQAAVISFHRAGPHVQSAGGGGRHRYQGVTHSQAVADDAHDGDAAEGNQTDIVLNTTSSVDAAAQQNNQQAKQQEQQKRPTQTADEEDYESDGFHWEADHNHPDAGGW